MERRIQKIKTFFKFTLITGLFFLVPPLFSQTPDFTELIRIPMWAELDAYPEVAGEQQNESDNIFTYPVSQLKKTAPFLICGMVYGWDFIYVPYDKARGVEEYFEITEKQSFEPFEYLIQYKNPVVEGNEKISCWCEYRRDDFQIHNYYLWNSIQHPVIKGRGYGNVSDGFEGFTDAAKDALKNAVREHYRKIEKNKPKEIRGSVLIKDAPLSSVVSGRYVINLDFFLEYGKIIQYTNY